MLIDFDGSKCPEFCPNFEFTHCTYYDPADNDKECGFCKKTNYSYRCLADLTRGIPLSYSSVGDFLTCHKLYYLKAIRGIQTRDNLKSTPLKLGSLWDQVLQKHLGNTSIDIPAIINQYEIPDRDVAKVKALYRAYKTLGIEVDPGYELQAKIGLTFSPDVSGLDGQPMDLLITGYYDRKYLDHFIENKLSGRPDNYLDPYFIQSQCGVYFLADTNLQSCTMEIARTPDLKSTGKNKEEDADTYSERCYQDIISRPSYYFIGYNRETHRYGKKFHRAEFNTDDIKNRFKHIFREICSAWLYDGWYPNDRVCNNILPGISCDMKSICSNNDHMSEEVFEIRKRKVTF
jgi:hypothetical protein